MFFFIPAILLLIVCFFSPLSVLSEYYLFSAHMVVHVLLLLIIAPLLVLSIPVNSFTSFFSFFRKYPFISWITGVGIMWFWHIPGIFNNIMKNMHQEASLIRLIEIVSLLVAGIIFSAPVIHLNKQVRINALTGVVYLFTACIGCSALGILISFAGANTYHHYLAMHDLYGLNEVITEKWQLTQMIDQQIAGLIMWVPCCLVYVCGAMYLLISWFKEKEVTDTNYARSF